MDITTLREELNQIDNEMIELFQKRMEICSAVGEYKKENHIPVLDTARERDILNHVTEKLDSEYEGYGRVLFSSLLEMSRSYQYKKILGNSNFQKKLSTALENTSKEFPKKAIVACQGAEGAYAQLACEKIFALPNIMYFSSFEGVFQAVNQGLCEYGILPLENSAAGSVNEVYDLMNKYKFYIVRSAKVHVKHALLGVKGAELSDIREIYSHQQALEQSSEFIKTLPNVKVNVCENTATAARMVSKSGRKDVAAICSIECAELYRLSVLSQSVQNTDNNHTRFICISKNLEVYPGAHKTSLQLTISHKPGSLYRVISKFNALGINLNKLESRPISGRDFEFKFYFDLDVSVYSPEFCQLIGELENEMEQFNYLGSYSEISQ